MRQFSILILAIVTSVPAFGQKVHKVWQAPFINGIAAKAEGEIITFEELRREMIPVIPQIQRQARTQAEFDKMMGELYLEVLQSLVDRILIVHHFFEEEFKIPPGVIEDEYERVLRDEFNNDRVEFMEFLQAQGLTPREFRQELQKKIIAAVMRNEIRRTESEISPEMIEEYYRENQDQFFEDEKVHLRIILLKSLAGDSMRVLEETAAKAITELEGGADFAEVAKKYSNGGRRRDGGDWGWVERGDLRSDLEEVAFALTPGEFSKPFATGNQIFILFAEERKAAGVQPLADVREQIEKAINDRIFRQEEKKWLERLRRDAFIQYF